MRPEAFFDLQDVVYRASRPPASLGPEDVRGEALDDWLARGWYRMQQGLFTVSHLFHEGQMNFQKVWWLRFEVPRLAVGTSQKALRRRNRDLEIRLVHPYIPRPEYEDLYARYRESRDFDGYPDVASASMRPEEPNRFDSYVWELRQQGELIGAGLFDAGAQSAASILHWFAPEAQRRSLGRYLMGLTAQWCAQTGRRWYYPGYVVAGYPKMDYKLLLGTEAAEVYDPRGPGGQIPPGPPSRPGWAPDHRHWIPFEPALLQPVVYPRPRWLQDFWVYFLG